jgi:hypothetical protein
VITPLMWSGTCGNAPIDAEALVAANAIAPVIIATTISFFMMVFIICGLL